MPQTTTLYQRDKLYAEVWAEPVDRVAKRYAVSGVALAKICRKLGVPLPERGYWARKRAGQRVEHPKLPPLKAGAQSEFRVTQWEAPQADEPKLSPKVSEMAQAERAPEAAIIVRDELCRPHKLVATSLKLLRKEKVNFRGYIRCRSESCLEVAIGPASIDRVMRIFDALLRALEQRGLEVALAPARPDDSRSREAAGTVPSGATRVGVDGEWIGFGIIERILHKRPPPPKGGDPSQAKVGSFFIRPRPELVPSGELTLVARPLDDAVWITRTWHDTKTRKIEQCLNEFVVQLYALAEEVKAGRIARERQARAQADEARRRWEDQERERDLRERLERWRLARDVRAYVREAHALAENAEVVIVKGGDLDEHLSWAAGFADHIDPWRGLRDDIARIAAERGNPEKS